MELLDSSMDKIADKVYNQLKSTIPESILGKMSVAVSLSHLPFSSSSSSLHAQSVGTPLGFSPPSKSFIWAIEVELD